MQNNPELLRHREQDSLGEELGLKVMFINSVYKYGSTGHIVNDLVGELKANGHEALVCFGRHQEKADKDSIVIGNKFEQAFSVLGSRFLDNHGLMNKRATKKLITRLKQNPHDLLHIHNLHGYYINVPLLMEYIKSSGKPVIFTMHDEWMMTGHEAYRLDSNQNHSKKYPKSLIFDRSSRNLIIKERAFSGLQNATIVSPSKWLAAVARESYLGDQYPVKIINNGIDTVIFNTKNRYPKDSNNKIVLGVASVWEKRKGLDDFMKLRSLLPNNYTIKLVGLSKKQAAEAPKGVYAITRVESRQGLADIYRSATVYVNPTYEDNYPTTNLESLACGTPVITYSTGGSGEAVTHTNGRVVEVGNLKQLAEAIIQVSEAGTRPTVNNLERYSKQLMTHEYLELYSTILSGHKNEG